MLSVFHSRRAGALALLILGSAAAAGAYVGPGAGFAVVTSFFAVGASLFLAVLALLTLPIRNLIRRAKRKRAFAQARVKRVVVLGLDGLSPVICNELLAAGELPNLARLAAEGTFKTLATTVPPVSPCAWSSFQTGTTPARHNIFDFLTRDRATYLPDLSSARLGPSRRHLRLGPYLIPLGKPEVRLLRKSQPFWKILGDHGVFSNIIRVPITFPPEKFYGVSLSAMCAPDLLGTQGTFTYFMEEDGDLKTPEGGRVVKVARNGKAVVASLEGPGDPLRPGRTIALPIKVSADGDGRALLMLGDRKLKLRVGEYSGWTPVMFRGSLGVKVGGAARFLLKSWQPFALYVTPLNVDPDKPAVPISHPYTYAPYFSKLLDRFATLGLAEDTWALNEGVLTEDEFLNQVWTHHAEREAMFFDALAKTRAGVVACVFDTSDRIQHMFFRYRVADHPANRGRDTAANAGVLADMYRRMDALVGETAARLQPGDLFVVMSDHGFVPFTRGVNINAWLEREGYLVLKAGESGGRWLAGVDWSRSRAFAVGLAGIYLNIKGREAQGIVARGDAAALKAEIKNKLAGLYDDERKTRAVREVYDLSAIYKGPYLEGGPELIVGYEPGYRASWDCAVGGTGGPIFEDNVKAWSGDHCVAAEAVPGVLFTNGRVHTEKPRMEDVAPTILALFGVAPPAYMEGKPWEMDLPEIPKEPEEACA